MNHRLIRVLTLALIIAGTICTHASDSTPTNQVFHTRGLIRQIAPDRLTAIIRHDNIPDYMPAMTMEFNLRQTNELAGIAPGDTISFRLTATDDTHWIDQIRKTGSATNTPPVAKPPAPPPTFTELKPGDLLPDSELLAEHGQPIHFTDFRGQALAFTFIFSRCPLPDYCPRMGNNFSKARDLILATPNAPTNWQFLSISFDPEFDQPGILASYANFYRKGNADRWLFAAASLPALAELSPRLDLMINREDVGSISHNLRTVVLDPQGRIHRQFDGNQWTPRQLADAILEAAQSRHP